MMLCLLATDETVSTGYWPLLKSFPSFVFYIQGDYKLRSPFRPL